VLFDIRDRLRASARRMKQELGALAGAMRDPRTPWLARTLAFLVLAYAASPIDLIPDFIPVLGLLDDLILVPLGIWLVLRLVPAAVMAEHRARAAIPDPRLARSGLAIMVAIWLASAALLWWWLR
jgi:uncharacterized membrane protein YkvA (DUF1232 family)